ncbi:hypothetical protein [Streptomyces hokutonensis]|uniref:hypothetical protein n=1 Tax=Streptomyces hokutonensis TaxID=1306990 RepID=UPI00368E1A44
MYQPFLPQSAEHRGEYGPGRPGHGKRDGTHTSCLRPAQLSDQAFQREQFIRGEMLEMFEYEYLSTLSISGLVTEKVVGKLEFG